MTLPYLQPRLLRSNRRMWSKNQTNFNFGHSQKPVVIENASTAGVALQCGLQAEAPRPGEKAQPGLDGQEVLRLQAGHRVAGLAYHIRERRKLLFSIF